MAHERAHQIWDDLVPTFEALPDVALGRMFGTIGLGVRGKIFAFIGTDGDLVAKVGHDAASALVDSGIAELKVMRGKAMREWVSLQIEHGESWKSVMHDAYEFVDALAPAVISDTA